MKSTKPAPRGIRNNNPLNIRIGNTWLGEVPNPTDSDFEQFVSPEYGLRAAFCILRRYIRRYGRNTPRAIITAWAPSIENNVNRYVGVVEQRAHLDPGAPILYEDKATMCALVAAMAYMENGVIIDGSLVARAYDMA